MLSKPARRVFSAASSAQRKLGSGLQSKVCVVLGSQWGDEGKGKLTDMLAKNYDVIARFNGGSNAGHTIVVEGKKFAFHMLPSGLIYPHTTNLIGNGTVVDIEAIFKELKPLEQAGIDTKGRLLISDRAQILFDFHKLIDGMQEERLSKDGTSIGTTKKGIGPAYASKASRNSVRIGHLLHMDSFKARLKKSIEQHQRMYGFDYDVQAEIYKYEAYAAKLGPMIVDGVHYINNAIDTGKRVLAEGANAAMLDLDFGTFPYVTSSTTTAGGVATGLGIAPNKLECVMGVVKAYTTRVGGGPFPTELTDDRGGGDRPRGAPETDIGLHLQNVGFEIGVTTGRKRRCGWLDAVVLKYSHMLNNYSGLNITKLDVLDALKEVKIGVAYKINGKVLPPGAMPSTLESLKAVEVVYETLPGWNCDTTKCRTWDELPSAARQYLTRVEEVVGVPITWVGVGAGREAMIPRF